MLDYLRRKLRSKKILQDLNRKIRGSIKEPCFRFWPIALILFGFVFFSSGLIKNCLIIKNVFEGSKREDFFVSPLSGFFPESPEVILIGNSFVKASSPLTFFSPQVLGVMVDDYQEQEQLRTEIIEHIVESKETISLLAEKYNVSLETVLWANNLDKNSQLKIGQKLIILPVSGIVHYVKSGDTVSEIAEKYKGKTSEIIAFNELISEADIYIGDLIIVPNGSMPVLSVQKQSIAFAPSVPLASSFFIIPVSSPYIITQWLHWYNAIDFSHKGNSCGKPIFAAAGGTIQKTGYHGTAGNYVRILHPNGVVTLYGHLSVILVFSGQAVSQGTPIGHIGNTGYTIGQTGCHLHFEVRGGVNPFAR